MDMSGFSKRFFQKSEKNKFGDPRNLSRLKLPQDPLERAVGRPPTLSQVGLHHRAPHRMSRVGYVPRDTKSSGTAYHYYYVIATGRANPRTLSVAVKLSRGVLVEVIDQVRPD